MRCPHCNGTLIPDIDGYACLNCGWQPTVAPPPAYDDRSLYRKYQHEEVDKSLTPYTRRLIKKLGYRQPYITKIA